MSLLSLTSTEKVKRKILQRTKHAWIRKKRK